MPLLTINNLSAGYSNVDVVFDVNLAVNENKIVTILGSNGSGKSTVLKVICGYLNNKGDVVFQGEKINRTNTGQRVESGIVLVPEGKLLFPQLTIFENLKTGAMSKRAKPHLANNLERIYNLFPQMKERKKQLAGTLSGGEQQMVAMGRGLMAHPKLLMLDEPTLGLAPLLVKEVFKSIEEINQQGTTVLLVEQNVHKSLEISDYTYVLQNGMIKIEGKSSELLENAEIKKAYMGL